MIQGKNMSRFNSIGVFGKKGTSNNTSDPAITGLTIELPIVASASAQNTGVFLAPGQTINAFINVKAGEATGTTKTVSVGIAGGSGTEIIDAADVSSVAIAGTHTQTNIQLADEITYTLGSADFAELDAELILQVVTLGV